MNPNQKFIDGTWYDEEYSLYFYRQMYINTPEPLWARECNDYGIDLINLMYGLPMEAKILDCGSGVGRIMQAWRRRGFVNVHGIEISHAAVHHANDPRLVRGSVADMSMFDDGEFDLVTSFALLEHIDESIEDQVVKEMLRVGKKQAHYMGLDAGSDPSHINIKSIDQWGHLFARHAPDKCAFFIKGPLLDDPMLIVFKAEEVPHPLRNKVIQGQEEKECTHKQLIL